MTTPNFPDEWEILSAYMDGQLSNREMEQVRQRLDTQPDLQRALDELQRTRMVLRSAPRRRAPRNFTLTPAMVPQRRSWFKFAPAAFSFASGLAVIMLVVSFTFTLLPGLNNSSQMLAAAPAADTQVTAGLAPKSSDQYSTTDLPPIIVWGGGAGRGGGGGGPETAPSGLGGAGGGAAEGNEAAPTVDIANATPPPSLVQPPLPAESTTPEPLLPERNAAPLQGTGPILGIRPTQEMGKIEITPEPARSLSYAAPEPAPAEQPSFWTRNLGSIQIGLVLLALGFGLAAIFLRRRS